MTKQTKTGPSANDFFKAALKYKKFLEDRGVECIHLDTIAGQLANMELRSREEERKNICEKFQGLIEGDNAKCSCELLIKSICKN